MKRERRSRIALVLAGLLIVGAIYSQGVIGRTRAHDQSVAGCNRSVLTRVDDIARDDDIWLAATTDVARRRIRARQERTRDLIVYCPDAYPTPSVLPWKG